METQKTPEIHIKKFAGRIPITGDIFSVLQDEDIVLLRRKSDEIHIMKKAKYDELIRQMKEKSGYSDVQLHWTRTGNDFMRTLCAHATPVTVHQTYLSLAANAMMKKRLEGKDLLIKFLI